MDSNKKTARLAGLIYLIVVLSGIFSLACVPSKLIVRSDASQTFQNIVNSELLFRFGILIGIVCYSFFLILPLVLYQLLRSVNEACAKLMVILAVVSVPISFLNLQHKFAVLSLITEADYLKAFDSSQLQALTMFHLDSYSNGILIVQVFWGLWLLPFGYLVYKSGFLPKILGVFLMLGCFGYLIDFIGTTVVSNYSESVISHYAILPASFGEIGTCLWLLIIGVKSKQAKDAMATEAAQ